MLGVLVHVIGDALNNIGVIIAALVIWQTNYEARFYADPGVSMGIAIMILLSALPLVKNSGLILLQSAPRGVDISDVKHDIEKVLHQCPIPTSSLLPSLSLYSARGLHCPPLSDPRHRIRARAARLAPGPEEGDCLGARCGFGPECLQLHGEGEDR